MRAGALRHYVTIERPVTSTADPMATGNKAYETVANVWAAIEPISGTEFFANEKHNSNITHRIKIRYKQGIEPEMRIKFKGSYYYFEKPMDSLVRGREYVILARQEL